jgi:hippurate hydrolase
VKLRDEIARLARAYKNEFIEIRRHLHAYPELSYVETETCRFVEAKLESFGINPTHKGGTGLVAIIEGINPASRTIALRADMDALPIQEENDLPYKSTKPGIMHACGHDAHTAVLLGASKILMETREHWEGTVKLIFQPGEEKNPGGATYMIRDGALQNPAPEGIVALHVHPSLDVGRLSFRKGTVMASADEIYISIKSRGGHAAAPQLTVDTILVASHLVVSLQQIISRNNNPLNPSVLSITSFQGGYTTNVIPSEVKLMGTLRCLDEAWRSTAHELITRHVTHIAEAMGAEATIVIDKGYPTVLNNPDLTENAWRLSEEYLGEDMVEETEMRMGAEDFGYYAQKIPGTFYRLGVMNTEKGITSGVHTPTFQIDEDSIEVGMGTMAWLGAKLRMG